MGKAEKKFAKKKEREREVRKKILARREKLHKEAKDQRIKELLEYKYREKLEPILSKEKAEQIEIHKSLEHNLEILKALEEEYLSQLSEEERAKVPKPEDLLKSRKRNITWKSSLEDEAVKKLVKEKLTPEEVLDDVMLDYRTLSQSLKEVVIK